MRPQRAVCKSAPESPCAGDLPFLAFSSIPGPSEQGCYRAAGLLCTQDKVLGWQDHPGALLGGQERVLRPVVPVAMT